MTLSLSVERSEGDDTLMVHPLDHLVLPVADLRRAREVLGRLGFTVAPDGHHPFGTSNACVFFADGTYLEPLAVSDPLQYEISSREGNTFIRRDEVYRSLRGQDGFSSVALGTADAAADHRAFRETGFSGGDLVEFSRTIVLPDGSEAVGAFRLAFAADLRAPDIFLFACQRLAAFPSDRKALETHLNGVTGIKAVLARAEKPAAFGDFLTSATGEGTVRKTDVGLSIDLGRAQILVSTPDGLESGYGIPFAGGSDGLQAVGIVFASANLTVTASHLAANGVTYAHRQDRILVKPAPGQGAVFAFEETK